jgi:hypothetical protein
MQSNAIFRTQKKAQRISTICGDYENVEVKRIGFGQALGCVSLVGALATMVTACGSAATPLDAKSTDGGDSRDGSTIDAKATAWKPLMPGTAWQWQLQGTVNETVLDASSATKKMYDIDMFDATPALVARLQAKGIYVVCYVESGDWNQARPDAGDFAPAILGNVIAGFPSEKFINVNALDTPAGPTGKTLRQIMTARFDLARSKGCDGIEPDLDDLHNYPTGFTISMANQVTYNTFLIAQAHSRGMSLGLKNGLGDTEASSIAFVKAMVAAGADWVVNEECNQFAECGPYRDFISAGRAVFQVEYLDNQTVPYMGPNGTCAADNTANFDGIVKDSSSSLAALPRFACR